MWNLTTEAREKYKLFTKSIILGKYNKVKSNIQWPNEGKRGK